MASKNDAQTDLAEWESDLDQSAMDRAVAAGDIRPKLDLPKVGASEVVTFQAPPRLVQNAKLANGQAWFVDVLREPDRLECNMALPKTLRFSLGKEKRLKGFATLVGRTFRISAERAISEQYGSFTAYRAHLLDQDSEASE